MAFKFKIHCEFVDVKLRQQIQLFQIGIIADDIKSNDPQQRNCNKKNTMPTIVDIRPRSVDNNYQILDTEHLDDITENANEIQEIKSTQSDFEFDAATDNNKLINNIENLTLPMIAYDTSIIDEEKCTDEIWKEEYLDDESANDVQEMKPTFGNFKNDHQNVFTQNISSHKNSTIDMNNVLNCEQNLTDEIFLEEYLDDIDEDVNCIQQIKQTGSNLNTGSGNDHQTVFTQTTQTDNTNTTPMNVHLSQINVVDNCNDDRFKELVDIDKIIHRIENRTTNNMGSSISEENYNDDIYEEEYLDNFDEDTSETNIENEHGSMEEIHTISSSEDDANEIDGTNKNAYSKTDNNDRKNAPILYLDNKDVMQHCDKNGQMKLKKYQCLLCEKSFMKKRTILIHIDGVHLKHHKWKCSTCSKIFPTKSNRNRHIRTVHLQEKPIQCTKCDKKFSYVSDLQSHQIVHIIKEHYNCNICQIDFPSQRLLNAHQLMHRSYEEETFDNYGPVKKKSYVCELCGRNYSSISEFIYHKLMKHNTIKRRYKCFKCPKSFLSQSSRRYHTSGHSDTKLYKRNNCDQSIEANAHLEINERLHIENESHKCSVCHSTFTLASDLTVHLRQHIDEKPYACNICTERFHYLTGLNRHKFKEHQIPYPEVTKRF